MSEEYCLNFINSVLLAGMMKIKENDSSALLHNLKKKFSLHKKLVLLLSAVVSFFAEFLSLMFSLPLYITIALQAFTMLGCSFILTKVLFRSEHQMITIGNSASLIVKNYKYSGKRGRSGIKSATVNNASSTNEVPYDKSFEEHLYNDPNRK